MDSCNEEQRSIPDSENLGLAGKCLQRPQWTDLGGKIINRCGEVEEGTFKLKVYKK